MSLPIRPGLVGRVLSAVITVAPLFTATPAFAWGERGHDLIARVAVRLVGLRGDHTYGALLQSKEHMMGHLANVPDIVWRNMGKEIEDQNYPTHYVDLEFLSVHPTYGKLPESPAAEVEAMRTLCASGDKAYVCPDGKPEQLTATAAGTAMFRIRQLFNAMKDSLAKAKAAPAGDAGKKERNAAVDQALLFGGTMAHFVGDLGQPLHATRDYNGFERGQGGAHKYYEQDCVDALDLGFDQEVFNTAKKMRPLERPSKVVPKAELAAFSQDPLKIAYALVLDSFSRIDELYKIDKQFAVTKAGSSEKGLKIPAERKPAAQVAEKFRSLSRERMATAADALATLWILAFEQAGKPDLASYQSWDYPTTPAFIAPDYM